MEDKILFPSFTNRDPDLLATHVREEAEWYRSEIREIKECQETPTFKNTILALEEAGKGLDLASSVFFNLLSCDADDRMMELSQELTPLLSDINNEVGMDSTLAERVRVVYEEQKDALSEIDQRLTFRTYESYQRGGAYLPERIREELKRLRKELSMATLTFGQNILKEQNAFTLQVTDEESIKRLPVSALESAKSLAREQNKEGWIFNLSMPSYSALLKYCDDRSIREQIYMGRATLGMDRGKGTCNIDLVYKIASIRYQIAQLLGYKSFADYRLSTKMAKLPTNVLGMLDELREAYAPLAQKEITEVTNGFPDYQPWDWSYLAEKYRQKYLRYDEEQTRPYFELNCVVRAMFDLAGDLYELRIEETKEFTPYRPEVKVYKVTSHDKYVGTLLCDFFPRKGKRSGAWMTNFVEAYGDVRPVVSLVMNFTPPTESLPSLLTHEEVTTLFHEFGHGLHGLLTQVPYSSLSGTNVVHDFVELPSHFNENWVRQPEFIRTFAKHYKTGEPISDQLLDAIKRNTLFLEGYACIRQLGFGYLDMLWHANDPDRLPQDIEVLEQEAYQKVTLLPHIEGTSVSTAFSHIFSGGYAAGYYGYKWAELLEADAFEEFLKHGLHDHETSMRFKREILERGDADEPEVLYHNFKGRTATIEALKRRSGLIQ
ncbi:MAG: M3 family metallopeptidase [Bacteroidales bacterium]|uniref:M3 family metallopeptidase n=1 Tax=Porphyromonas sp. TaxID=1924944 RepID=UPI002979D23D|nr:M3 family metallopeptidase [Porphyromonas sp.]MDD7437567.1 M3 family metallopeptidase [Bacteroidales bacterium]MDY3067256.1 M3 family metallopeptidase [Porphyromonas sp.]